ncbi:penicillin-binding protein [Paenibacillus anaericanus]|uniref:transglycosylase domain-containing protein n=1 Tax=Paenibacillus anaericanus TaxID=170367 RepID=UPI00278811CC|nr:transglycosylase domain-containing protein [Paenibacillus anaericanus]MDQ0088329.1 penicillin-binding protein [Paenibacillus anaericanus]
MVDTNDKNSGKEDGLQEDKPPIRKPKRGRWVWKTLGWLTLLVFAGVLFAGGAVFGYVSSIVKDDPVRSRADIEAKMNYNEITGFAYFRDGSAIGQLRSEEDRRPISYEEIPSTILEALIAIEDNNFEKHIGVDFKGTLRAVKERLLKEDVQTGGSTLTQQLARRVFLSLDRTDNRKVKEMLLALRLERFLSKPEIITAYLNKVPFGNGSSGYQVYGIKAAAKGIFNANNLEDLNIAQSAYLAGLPQLPSSYSAYNGKGEFNPDAFDRAIKRQRLVLQRMLEENKITNEEYNEALAFDLQGSLAKTTKKAYETFPYLMLETERQAALVIVMLNNPEMTKEEAAKNPQLIEEARQQLLTGGYRVYTTIDKKVYTSMHTVSENEANFSPFSETKGLEQVAAMMINNKTSEILGMIEGRDFYTEQMNYATQMVRQPGSTMKPIAAYLPAMELGLIQPASIIDDSPIILRDYSKGYHIPVNSSGGYKGLVTARTALNESRNVPALKIFNQVLGIEKAWDFTKKLGITTLDEKDYSAQTGVLGGLSYGVTVEELTNAYSSIANGGEFNDAYMIAKITDSKGNLVYKHNTDPQRVFSKQTAYLMTDMLRTVITSGTAKSIQSDFKSYGKIPVVGKTGSTQNYADVWFMGFTPDVSLGVWVGYKEPVNTLSTAGKTRAKSIWSLVMNEVTANKPDLFPTTEFVKPDGIVRKTVSGYSGKLPTALTSQGGKLVTDIFNSKFVPTESDDVLIRAKYITYEGVNYIPLESTPSDMVQEKVVMKREKPIKELIDDLQNAFKVMKTHKDISFYMPKDAGEDAPTKPDPRVDDGFDPSAPVNVRLSSTDSSATITFNANKENDIVGYRLYKSIDGNSPQYTGTAVLTGGATTFTDSISSDHSYSYYVTAVDVAGRESGPSATVGYEGWLPPDNSEQLPDLGESIWPGDDSGNAGGELSIPATPSQVTITSGDNGLTVSWGGNASKDQVSSYNVYLSATSDGAYSKIGSTPETQFTFKTDSPSGWVQVTATNSMGESTTSTPVQFNK